MCFWLSLASACWVSIRRRFSPELNILHRPDTVAGASSSVIGSVISFGFARRIREGQCDVAVERGSRFAVFQRNTTVSRGLDGLIQARQSLSHLARRSIPFDSGTELTEWPYLRGDVRRRRWTTELKLQIIEESYAPGETVSSAARRHGVAPNLLYRWRRTELGIRACCRQS
ncbi:Transposase [compost metagenome]